MHIASSTHGSEHAEHDGLRGVPRLLQPAAPTTRPADPRTRIRLRVCPRPRLRPQRGTAGTWIPSPGVRKHIEGSAISAYLPSPSSASSFASFYLPYFIPEGLRCPPARGSQTTIAHRDLPTPRTMPARHANTAMHTPAPPEVFNWRVYMIAMVASMGAFLFGYDLAFIGTTITQKSFKKYFDHNYPIKHCC